MLLDAGTNPNDNESPYHSTESPDLTCMQLLLEGGATVEGTNAVHHILDRDELDGLKLLLAYVKDFNALTSTIGNPLIWAIRRRRSRACRGFACSGGRSKCEDLGRCFRVSLRTTERTAGETLTMEDQFVVACARANETEARRILAERPNIFQSLSDSQLRQLPELMEGRARDAVKLMVKLGWPIAVEGGDWGASALNLAIFQGNAEMTRFLLEHGAAWTERHGFNGNVRGALSWASRTMIPKTETGPAVRRHW